MKNNNSQAHQNVNFTDEECNGLYKVIFNRRDVRGQFKPDPIPDDVLSRVLYAAHHAPSVGYMQPWNFIIITDKEIRKNVNNAFIEANAEAVTMFEKEKQTLYSKLKLEGIVESPVNICITCDRNRTGPVVIGRTHNKIMDMYSSVCSVQNLWLAARAEGLGVGWVSIFKKKALQDILKLPKHVVPIAYLCIGYVSHFYKKPELETANWLPRLPLEELISFNEWNNTESADDNDLIKQIITDKNFPTSIL